MDSTSIGVVSTYSISGYDIPMGDEIQTVDDTGEIVKCSQDVRNPVTIVKPIIYVSPRLDQSYYQAEVADVSSLIAPSSDTTRGIAQNLLIASNFFHMLCSIFYVISHESFRLFVTDSNTNWFTGTRCVSSVDLSKEDSITGTCCYFMIVVSIV